MKSFATDPSTVSKTVTALLSGIALAAFAPAHAQSTVANSPIAADAPPTLQAGPLDVTFGGFTALESVWRSKDEQADIGSNYNTAIPYPDQVQDHLDEFRESARQSRFAMLVEGPHDGPWSAQSYLETDFLSAAATSTATESNSYSLRMRHFYGVLRNDSSNWYLLAGQTWSLATLSTSGTLKPRAEQVPLTIDAQYVVGFNWARQAQLRFVKLFGNSAAFAISFENPATAFTGGTPSTTLETEVGGSGGLFSGTQAYSLDFVPDTIAKVAFDPGWGHYEIFGMERGFRDYYEPSTTTIAGTTNTTFGGSGGAGLILPFGKKLSFQASTLIGNGIGRYASGQLPDVTINQSGGVATIREEDLLLGLTFKPTSRLTMYAYVGEEQAARTAFNSATAHYGYGNLAYNNSGCYSEVGGSNTATLPSNCVANTQKLEQIILGEWWKAYEGSIGNFQIGLQYTYEDKLAFEGVGGAPSTNLNMGFVSFRYYPYQR